jgi:hypothetical protein
MKALQSAISQRSGLPVSHSENHYRIMKIHPVNDDVNKAARISALHWLICTNQGFFGQDLFQDCAE